MKSGTLLGYRVIAHEEGTDLGKVRQIIFDAPRSLAAALLLGDKDLFGLVDAQVVPWNEIQQIGENAIIVNNATSRQKAGDLPEMLHLLEQKHLVPGAKIYTEGGTGLGFIKDVLFGEDGIITDYELSEGLLKDTLQGTRFMPAKYHLRVGEEVVFVESEGAKNLRSAPPDYSESVETLKQRASEAFDPETINRTAGRISQNLQKSIDDTAGKMKKAWKEGIDESPKTSNNKNNV